MIAGRSCASPRLRDCRHHNLAALSVHRLGFSKKKREKQSCAKRANLDSTLYDTTTAMYSILNEPNPSSSVLVYLGFFICAFGNCLCGFW